jgi:CRP-like cAMP-binding protein
MPSSDALGPVPHTNCLLAALPLRERNRLVPYLEPMPLTFKAVLYQAGQPITHVYFPVGGVLSLISTADGRSDGVEVGLVGREGMAGLAVFLRAETAPFRCVVQVPGDCFRMRAEDFRRRVGHDSTLHGILLQYTHAFLTQLSQSVACNSLHPIEQRLCRWLLAVHDRVEVNRFPLTHEFLAAMLGVRRASVTEAASGLRQAGLIRYGGGQLTVLQRPGLEETACGCHRVIQREFDRLPRQPQTQA